MVIQKKTLGEARQALKKYLKANYEDDPLNHPLGPPSIMWNPDRHGIPRQAVDTFWEIMLKEHVVAKHPLGGYMHPRFQFSDHPSVAEVKKTILADLKHVMDPNDEMEEPASRTPKVVYDFANGDASLRKEAVELFHEWLKVHATTIPLWARFMSEIDNPVPDLAYRASLRCQLLLTRVAEEQP